MIRFTLHSCRPVCVLQLVSGGLERRRLASSLLSPDRRNCLLRAAFPRHSSQTGVRGRLVRDDHASRRRQRRLATSFQARGDGEQQVHGGARSRNAERGGGQKDDESWREALERNPTQVGTATQEGRSVRTQSQSQAQGVELHARAPRGSPRKTTPVQRS